MPKSAVRPLKVVETKVVENESSSSDPKAASAYSLVHLIEAVSNGIDFAQSLEDSASQNLALKKKAAEEAKKEASTLKDAAKKASKRLENAKGLGRFLGVVRQTPHSIAAEKRVQAQLAKAEVQENSAQVADAEVAVAEAVFSEAKVTTEIVSILSKKNISTEDFDQNLTLLETTTALKRLSETMKVKILAETSLQNAVAKKTHSERFAEELVQLAASAEQFSHDEDVKAF
jgi:hypothetical protein